MKPVTLTRNLLEELGLLGTTELDDVLIFHFTNRDEVWTLAPADYPTDGTREVLRFDGRFWVPPPEGPPS